MYSYSLIWIKRIVLLLLLNKNVFKHRLYTEILFVFLMLVGKLFQVTTFCDNDVRNLNTLHNDEAPSEHNILCEGRSAWEVMREHDDFKTGASRKYLVVVVLKNIYAKQCWSNFVVVPCPVIVPGIGYWDAFGMGSCILPLFWNGQRNCNSYLTSDYSNSWIQIAFYPIVNMALGHKCQQCMLLWH